MMCVALLNNPSGRVGETTGQRSVARLGQLVLLLELIGNVQNARRVKEAAANVCMAFLARSDQQFYSFLLVIRYFFLGCYQVCNRSGKTFVKFDRRKGRSVLSVYTVEI